MYCKFIQKSMTSRVTYTGELRTLASHLQSGSSIETDAPTDNHGKGERFSPTDLIGTSLAACMLTTMAIRAKELEQKLKGAYTETEKIMSAAPRRISGINITFIGLQTSVTMRMKEKYWRKLHGHVQLKKVFILT